MIKKIRFWVHCLRGFLGTYEEAVNEYGINPLDNVLNTKKNVKPSVPKTGK